MSYISKNQSKHLRLCPFLIPAGNLSLPRSPFLFLHHRHTNLGYAKLRFCDMGSFLFAQIWSNNWFISFSISSFSACFLSSLVLLLFLVCFSSFPCLFLSVCFLSLCRCFIIRNYSSVVVRQPPLNSCLIVVPPPLKLDHCPTVARSLFDCCPTVGHYPNAAQPLFGRHSTIVWPPWFGHCSGHRSLSSAAICLAVVPL